MFPKPGTDTTPVAKISLVTKVGDLGCGVGYYKSLFSFSYANKSDRVPCNPHMQLGMGSQRLRCPEPTACTHQNRPQ